MSEVKQIEYQLYADHIEAWSVRETGWENEDGFTDCPHLTARRDAIFAFTEETTARLFWFLHQWSTELIQATQPQRVTFQVCMEGLVALKQVYAIERICGALCVSANAEGLNFYDFMPIMEMSFTLWNDQAMLAQGSVPPHLAMRN